MTSVILLLSVLSRGGNRLLRIVDKNGRTRFILPDNCEGPQFVEDLEEQTDEEEDEEEHDDEEE